MHYTLTQWLLFFYTYCFLGWVWESCYVSIRKGHWINRGFLHGPMLPIYGFGAVIILFVTLPVRESILLIYLSGLVGATLLEYLTGFVMEKLFHVKYWDYSQQPFNLNGYICLGCSLGWGAFSVILIKLIHPWIEKPLIALPNHWVALITGVISCFFITDVIQSAIEALDLKQLLSNIDMINQQLKSISGQLEVLLDENIREIEVRNEKWREKIRSAWDEQNTRQLEKITSLQQVILEQMEKANSSTNNDYAKANQERAKAELAKMAGSLEEMKKRILHNASPRSARSLRIIWRNPNMISRKHPEAINRLLASWKKEEEAKKKTPKAQKD